MNLADHFNHAQRKATYGHRHWIVWTDATGEPHSAIATAGAIERAIADTRGRKFWGYTPSNRTGNILSPAVADAWLNNARNGTLARSL